MAFFVVVVVNGLCAGGGGDGHQPHGQGTHRSKVERIFTAAFFSAENETTTHTNESMDLSEKHRRANDGEERISLLFLYSLSRTEEERRRSARS